MVNSVKIRGNEEPFKMSNVYPKIRVYPKIDHYAERKSHAHFPYRKPEEIVGDKDLRSGEEEKVC